MVLTKLLQTHGMVFPLSRQLKVLLGEAHSILQRMNELAVQGANDTNESIDRDAINEELSALTSELDRIASTTQFNKQNLLDGKFTSKNLRGWSKF